MALGLGIGLSFNSNLLGGNWQDVSAPQGMVIPMPFNVQRQGNNYRVDPSFDIQTRANITVTKSYYVDSVSGSDSNDGLSEGAPLKTLTAANAKGDGQRFYLKRGSYWFKNQRPTQFTGSAEFLPYGTGAKPIITADTSNQFGSFSATDNYYSASAPDFVGRLYDFSDLDSDGQPRIYTNAGSIAGVDATAGTFFWSASTIYVRTFDDRAPDSDLLYLDNLCYRVRQDNISQYFNNIEFRSTLAMQNGSSTGGTKSYFKDCDFKFGEHQFWGQAECIIQDSNVTSLSGDACNIDDYNTVTGYVYEVNSFFSNYGNGAGNAQGSTIHNASNAVSIAGIYSNTAGQCIGDTGTGQRWVLGCELGQAGGGITFETQANAWIEGSTLSVDAVSINSSTGGSVYYKNNTLAGSVTETGIYAPYVENANYLAYKAKLSDETITAPSTLQQYLGNRLVAELDALGSVYDVLMIAAQDGSKEASSVSPYRTSQLFTLNGTLTYTSDAGLEGDGSSGFIDTNYNPSQDGGNYTQDSACIFGYISTAQTSGDTIAGFDGVNSQLIVANSNTGVQRVNTGSNWGSAVDFSGTGFFMICRTASGEQKAYNGTTEYTSSSASAALPNANIEILRRAEVTYGDCEIGLLGIGSGSLWDNRVALRDAVNKYFNQL